MISKVIIYGQRPIIDKDGSIAVLQNKPRRLCLSMKDQACCFSRVDSGNILGKFYSKFPNSIDPIFHRETGLNLFKKEYESKTIYAYYIFDETTYNKVALFVNKYYQRVFIKDQLFVSMALGMHQEYKDGDDEPSHTKIGELECEAKYNDNKDAVQQLVAETIDFIKTTPYYQNATCICAMPSSKNLTREIARQVVLSYNNLKDLTHCLYFENEKEEVKGMDGDQRWDALEKANLIVKEDVKDQVVILFDDLYQSGMTMQYAAMKILEAGASNVYGLALVKSLRNNQ